MIIKVFPSTLSGTLDVISSKSLSHRAVIAAGLARGQSILHNLLDSEDLTATKNALTNLGAKIIGNKVTGGNLIVNTPLIHAKESGSTLRFLIPLALLFDQPITFTGENRLNERPLDVYQHLFDKRVTYQRLSQKSLPLTVSGPLKPGTFKIAGNVSSQFVTGLLFTLPLLKGDSVIELTTPLESRGYVDLTLRVLSHFGISVKEEKNRFIVPGNQNYQPTNYTVEGDYSQAAFFITAATFSGNITLNQLNPDSFQGDKKVVDIVQTMGGLLRINHDKQQLLIKQHPTKGTLIDLADIPDLGPILMILAGASQGTSSFVNVERLRLKESDRLKVMIDILNKLGVKTTLKDNTLTIIGVSIFKGNQSFDSYQDHRIVMALCVAAIKADGPIEIHGAEAINKSYPRFIEDYQALGGKIEVIKP